MIFEEPKSPPLMAFYGHFFVSGKNMPIGRPFAPTNPYYNLTNGQVITENIDEFLNACFHFEH